MLRWRRGGERRSEQEVFPFSGLRSQRQRRSPPSTLIKRFPDSRAGIPHTRPLHPQVRNYKTRTHARSSSSAPMSSPLGLVSPNKPARTTRAGAGAAPVKADPHAWETAKENYKPLAGGRTASALKDRSLPLGKEAGAGAAEAAAQA